MPRRINSEWRIDKLKNIAARFSLATQEQRDQIENLVKHTYDSCHVATRHKNGHRVYALLSVIMDDPIIIGK